VVRNGNNNVDIKFSADDVFLDKPSSVYAQRQNIRKKKND